MWEKDSVLNFEFFWPINLKPDRVLGSGQTAVKLRRVFHSCPQSFKEYTERVCKWTYLWRLQGFSTLRPEPLNLQAVNPTTLQIPEP